MYIHVGGLTIFTEVASIAWWAAASSASDVAAAAMLAASLRTPLTAGSYLQSLEHETSITCVFACMCVRGMGGGGRTELQKEHHKVKCEGQFNEIT